MHGAHVCMSGTLECSGVDPCDPCASAIVTYVLVPAMKAAGIDQRGDPRVTRFLQTYAEARRALMAGLMAQVTPPPAPINPVPSQPPMADVALTEAELEAMASPAPEGALATEEPAMAGGPEPEVMMQADPEVLTPPGVLTDEEFRARFPKVAPEEVMEGFPVAPPPPEPAPVSLLKLASQAITPTMTPENFVPPEGQEVIYKDSDSVITAPMNLPAETPASEAEEVGSAPTEPAPEPSPSQPKALTEAAASESAASPTPAE